MLTLPTWKNSWGLPRFRNAVQPRKRTETRFEISSLTFVQALVFAFGPMQLLVRVDIPSSQQNGIADLIHRSFAEASDDAVLVLPGHRSTGPSLGVILEAEALKIRQIWGGTRSCIRVLIGIIGMHPRLCRGHVSPITTPCQHQVPYLRRRRRAYWKLIGCVP